jgi:hypothetical protein
MMGCSYWAGLDHTQELNTAIVVFTAWRRGEHFTQNGSQTALRKAEILNRNWHNPREARPFSIESAEADNDGRGDQR